MSIATDTQSKRASDRECQYDSGLPAGSDTNASEKRNNIIFVPTWTMYTELSSSRKYNALISREIADITGGHGVFMITQARIIHNNIYRSITLGDSYVLISNESDEHPLLPSTTELDRQRRNIPVWCIDWVTRKYMGDPNVYESYKNEIQRLEEINIPNFALAFQLLPSYVCIEESYGSFLKVVTQDRRENCCALVLDTTKIVELKILIEEMKEKIEKVLSKSDIHPQNTIISPRSDIARNSTGLRSPRHRKYIQSSSDVIQEREVSYPQSNEKLSKVTTQTSVSPAILAATPTTRSSTSTIEINSNLSMNRQ